MRDWARVLTVFQLLTVTTGFNAIPASTQKSKVLTLKQRNAKHHVPFLQSRTSITSLHDVSNAEVLSSLYRASLNANPLETKLVTGAILAVGGDAIAQLRDPGDYDLRRAVSFASFDVIYRAIQCYLFPIIVANFFGQHLGLIFSSVDKDLLGPIEQTMVNQFIVIPFLYYPIFYSFTGIMQELPIDEIIERGRTTFWPLMRRNWLFWLPVQYYQFSYVDEPLQIPFLCLVGLVWTLILSASAGSVEKFREGADLEKNSTVSANSREVAREIVQR